MAVVDTVSGSSISFDGVVEELQKINTNVELLNNKLEILNDKFDALQETIVEYKAFFEEFSVSLHDITSYGVNVLAFIMLLICAYGAYRFLRVFF